MQRVDGWVFRHRAPLLALASAPLAWGALAAPAPRPAALAAGAALVVIGGALRLAAIRRLGKRARVSRAKAGELVASGPYAWVRSPLYLAALLILAGFGLLVGLGAWSAAPALAGWLIYDRAVRHEERTLLEVHGERAADYLRSVPRWLPRPPADDGVTPWREVLRREWRLVLGLPVGLGAAAALALTPLGPALHDAAARAAAQVGAPLWALVLLAAGLGALANALKTAHDVQRFARRRAALGQEGEDGEPGALSVVGEGRQGATS